MSRPRVWAGVDPGKTGAIAVVGDGVAEAHIYPGDVSTAADLLVSLTVSYKIEAAGVEKVHSMPRQGVASSFTFGANFGSWLGMLAALGIPHILIQPRAWQKAMLDAGTGETKERSLNMARRLYPDVDLSLKKHDGKADALHLARYCKRYFDGEFFRG